MWWRRYYPLLFALALAANLFELGSLTIFHWNGTTGIATTPTDTPYVRQAIGVDEPARSAGVRVGDLMDERELLAANQYTNPTPGRPYVLIVHRGARTIRATIDPAMAPIPWDYASRLVGVLWVLAFALLIVRRGAKTAENDYLALILVLLAFQSAPDRTVLPDARAYFFYQLLADPTTWVALLMVACYGLLFGKPVSPARRTLFVLTCGVFVASIVSNTFDNASAGLAWGVDTSSGWIRWPIALIGTAMFVMVLLNVAAAAFATKHEERARLAWVIASFIPFTIGVAAGNLALATGAWFALQNISFFFIPACLTYAALARRLFDVGFVLNRAAVFAVVSTLVVGAFMLLEWALGKWFEDLSRGASLAANGLLALGIGFSIRWIHHYVDRAVDAVFFRKRHESDVALRRFAHEAAFLTDADLVVGRTEELVLKHTDATSARVIFSKELDQNDPAVVAMRAWNEYADLHRYETRLSGELAFPMMVRGDFLGALICGEKRNGEHFAPDEIEALRVLSHGVALALNGLPTEQDDSTMMMLSRLERRLDGIAERLGVPDPLGSPR